MLTGEIRQQIDQIRLAGVSNPLLVRKQTIGLLFSRHLDVLHALEEARAASLEEVEWAVMDWETGPEEVSLIRSMIDRVVSRPPPPGAGSRRG